MKASRILSYAAAIGCSTFTIAFTPTPGGIQEQSEFPTPVAPLSGYSLHWRDEFNQAKLDQSKWIPWELGGRRDAINTEEALSFEDGALVVTTYSAGDQHFTGGVSTEGLMETTHGYFEARIHFSDASGTWSVFWLYDRSIVTYTGNPALDGVEIDIVEHRDVDPDGFPLRERANFTLHWGGYEAHHRGAGHQTADLDLDGGYHVYGCEWSPEGYRFYIDGVLLWTVDGPVSMRPQHIVLSTEIEAKSWAGPIPPQGYGDRETSQVKMKVDWVRVWKKM